MNKFKIKPATKLPTTRRDFTAFTTAKHRYNAKRTQAAQVAERRASLARKIDTALRIAPLHEVAL